MNNNRQAMSSDLSQSDLSQSDLSQSDLSQSDLSPAHERWLRLWSDRTPHSCCVVGIPESTDDAWARDQLARQVAAHDGLRTVFSKRGRHLATAIAPMSPTLLAWQNQSDPDPTHLQRSEIPWTDQSWGREGDPLVRAGIVIVEGRRCLAIVSPSWVLDDPSILALAQDLSIPSTAAGRSAADGPASTTEDGLQSSDIALWWRETLALKGEDGVTVWDELDHGPSFCQFFASCPPTSASASIAQPSIRLGDRAGLHLQSLSTHTGASVDDILLAAWATLVDRWSPGDELVLGEILDGRTMPELEGVLGSFSRAVPIRHRPGASSFRDLVTDVAERRATAKEHQHYFVLDHGRPKPNADFFPYLFQIQRPATPVRVEVFTWTSKVERFVLKLNLVDLGPESSFIHLEYDPDLVSHSGAEAVGEALVSLLAAAAQSPRACQSALHRAASARFSPQPNCQHHAAPDSAPEPADIGRTFDRVVSTQPEAPVLIDRGEILTYGQVRDRAENLSKRLTEAGLQPGDVAAIRFPKTAAAVISMLAVQKAGAIYFPLDPDLPRAQSDDLLRESGARALIEPNSENDAGITLIPATTVEDSAPQTLSISDGAYLLYTSGSTGRPVGSVITHRAVLDLVSSLETSVYRHFEGSVRVGLVASLHFDASVQQLYGALLLGHCLVLIPDEAKVDPSAIRQACAEHRISVLDGTPSVFSMLAGNEDQPSLQLTDLLIGGEPLSARLLDRIFASPGLESTRVTNLYGLTECAVDSVCWSVDKSSWYSWRPHPPPIGAPMAHSSIWIRDRFGCQTPDGLPGEICIGGSGVAAGYIGWPKLTKERFIPDPHHGGRTVFRTGDFGAIYQDRWIRCFGRTDAQAKLRGHRVDLIEIRAALEACEGVLRAVPVISRDEQNGDSLIAYVVTYEGTTVEECRRILAERLPPYKIPDQVIRVRGIPLTSSGKIDIHALESHSRDHLALPKTGPDAPLEDRIRVVFSELLGHPVAAGDDFFKVGGQSILALRAVERISRSLDSPVALKLLYDHSSARKLAARLDQGQRPENGRCLAPLRPASPEARNLYLLPSILGSSAIFIEVARCLLVHWNPIGCEYLLGDVPIGNDLDALAAALTEKICDTDPNREIFLVGFSFGAAAAFEIARNLSGRGRRSGLILVDRRTDPGPVRGLESSEGLSIPEPLAAMAATYRLNGRVDAPICAIEALDNSEPAHMELWASHSSAELHHLKTPGSHDTLFAAHNAPETARSIQRALEWTSSQLKQPQICPEHLMNVNTQAVSSKPDSNTILNPLDVAQAKNELENEGFTLAEGLLSTALAETLRDEAMHIIGNTQPPFSNLMQTSQYLEGSALDRLINSSELLRLSEQLCGGPCLRFLPFTAVKAPGGGWFQYHQDDQYRQFDAYGINFWFALNEVTEDNGCLWVVPGSHKKGTLPWVPTGDANRSRTLDFEPEGVIKVPMKPGDCLIFDRLTIHASGANQTEAHRVAYSITYSRDHANFLDVDGWKSLKEHSRWKTPPTKKLQLLSELSLGGHR